MKRFIALGLMMVFILLSFCGCNVIDTISELTMTITEVKDTEVEVITEEYYIFSPEFDSCYNSLNSNQKEIYKKIYSICEEMPKGYIKICKDYEKAVKDITVAYRAVLNDHAEIFWMPESYIVGRNSGGGYKKDICITFDGKTAHGKTVKYPVTITERNKMRRVLNSKVEALVNEAQKQKSQFEKEKFFNDYICANTEYVPDERFINTSYGCLVNKKAICEGYSRAFKLLCNKVGIECDLIVGKADGEGHMWNSVNIDGKHSYVDVTWNDRPDYPYFYFNITDEQLLFDHTLSPLHNDMPETEIMAGISFNFVKRVCSYMGNGYYEKYGYVLGDHFEYEYAEKAAQQITQNVNAKAEYTDFWLKSDRIKNEFISDEKAFIRNIQRKLNGIRITSYAFQRDILVIYCE